MQSYLINREGLRGVFVQSLEAWNEFGASVWSEMELLLRELPHWKQIVGLDTEWFRNSPLSVLQIATKTHCFVLHVSYFHNRQLPEPVKRLLESADVVKCGVNISQDRSKLEDIGIHIQSVMNVDEYAELLLQIGARHHSLKSLTALLLKEEMPLKKDKITRSNWELEELSEEQRKYAADDAVASWALGVHLVDIALEKNLVKSAEKNSLVNWLRKTATEAAQSLKSAKRQYGKELAKQQKKEAKIQTEPTIGKPAAQVTVLDRDGNYLFKCSQSQAKFYTVDRCIADVLEYFDDKTNKPRKIKLLFDPKRKTRLCVYYMFQLPCTDNCPFAHGIEDLLPESRLLLEEKTPSCAICLSLHSLVRHAVVPPSFRRYLPGRFQSPPEKDFLPICRQCQTAIVNKVDQKVKSTLEKAASINSALRERPHMVRKCCSYARLLTNKQKVARIPVEKVEELKKFIAENASSLGLTDAVSPSRTRMSGEGGPPDDHTLRAIASKDSSDIEKKSVMDTLVGTDNAKAEAFVRDWWDFMYTECCVQRKKSNQIFSEDWKVIKKASTY